jgi:signal transduction histidine kinase
MKSLLPQTAAVKVCRDISWRAVWLLACVVFAISLVAIDFTRNRGFLAALWPTNAIVLAVALRTSRSWTNYCRIFASTAIAIFLANVAGGHAVLPSAGFVAANITEIAFAAALLINVQGEMDLARVRPLCVYVVIAGGIAPVLGASIGAAVASHAHATAWFPIWLSWFASDALGMVIVGPFLLTLNSASWHALRGKKQYAEALAIFLLIVAVVVFAAYYRTVIFIIVPVILVAVYRFGIAGAAVGMFVAAVAGTVFIVKGIGGPPVISQASPAERIFALQIFLAATALWSFPVAAVLAERDRLMAELAAAKSGLEAENERKSQMVVGLHHRLVKVEEKERLRLSHELHDQTGQTLAAALLELSGIEKQLGEAERDRLHRVRGQVDRIAQAVHRISWELRPAAIDELGLTSALDNYVAEWSAQFGVPVDLHCDSGKLDSLPEDVRMTVYRVVGEALTNVCKHARGATAVSIVINREPSLLRLTITDDGCGFDPGPIVEDAAKSPADGLGLIGMQERLALIGGELEIESSAGAGTTLFARIPASTAAA